MAGGMQKVVLGSDVGHEVSVSSVDNQQEITNMLARGALDIEITALPEEKQHVAKAILRERMEAKKLISTYQRKCNSSGPGSESVLPRKPGDDQSPLAKLAYSYLPILTWYKALSLRSVQSDVIAGLTVGVMAIPQSMSYADIAGLQYIYGMYSAFVPTIIYALFGQSRQLAVGPVAMVSLLVQAGLEGSMSEAECPGWTAGSDVPQATTCPDEYAGLAFTCALYVGLFQVVGSLLNFGALINLLGHPVTSGFTSGAAIIIGLSQVKYFLGFSVPKSQYVYITIYNLVKGLGETNGMTLFLGLLWFAYLYVNKMVARRFKKLSLLGALGPLISCVVGILLMIAVKPLREEFHVKYIGDIPAGFPGFSVMKWQLGMTGTVLPTALTATLIGFMESIAIGKSLAAKHNYAIEAGQEMFALGTANLIGAMFSCYPVTGSFSRSAVANATGATSQLAGAVTGIVMLLTLLVLTSLFYYLPKFVLAAVVINSIIPLVAVDEARRLFRVKKNDFVLWMVAFLGTLFLGVLFGILLAVALSLIIVIFESVRPQITILWRIPGTTIYRSMKQESSGAFIENVFICRIGSSMYFANASYIKDTLAQYLFDLQEVNPIKYIILEMTPVTSIDSTAVHIIEDIHADFKSQGVHLALAMVGNRVEKTMKKASLYSHIGEEWFFPTVNDAVRYCLRHKHAARCQGRLMPDDSKTANELGVDDINIHSCTEVGFSNDLRKDCTVIFISLAKDVPSFMSAITAHFKKQHIIIHKAEVEPLPDEGAKHTYFVKSQRTGKQLVEYEIERLREDLGRLMQKYAGNGEPGVEGQMSPSFDAIRVAELEKTLRDQDQKLARINELLGQASHPNGGADEAGCGGACLPRVLR